ncbi:hypothetical protein ACFWIQ_19920 [Kitasatospora sp. NPDC127059]
MPEAVRRPRRPLLDAIPEALAEAGFGATPVVVDGLTPAASTTSPP